MLRVMKFLNLLDSENRLSLTNLAVYITLVKTLVSEAAPIDIAALVTATLNYAHKRHVIAKTPEGDSQQ
jgi:hypothetical protein